MKGRKWTEKWLAGVVCFLMMALPVLGWSPGNVRAEEAPEGISIHGSLEGREILFAEEDVPINAGTIFAPKADGAVTHVKLYTAKEEQGKYYVQIWDYELEEEIVSYEWELSGGVEGWRYFALPEPLHLNAHHNYMVSVMNTEESRYYARVEGYFKDGDDVSSQFVTTSTSGRFSLSEEVLPNNEFNQRTYLRDIVFVPGEGKEAPVQDADLSGYETVYVSDLKWGESYSNGTQVAVDGATNLEGIYFSGKSYDKGFSMYASPRAGDSFVEVNVEGLGFTSFAAYVGIPELLLNEVILTGSADFVVVADGKEIARSPVMSFGDAPYLLIADITGAKVLRFEVGPGGDGNVGDLAAWGNAVISRRPVSDGEKIFESAQLLATPTPEPTETPGTVTPTTKPGNTSSPEGPGESNGVLLYVILGITGAVVIAGVIVIVVVKRKK